MRASTTLVASLVACTAAVPRLQVGVEDDAAFSIKLDGTTWLASAPLRFFTGGWHQVGDPSHPLAHTGTKRYSGTDELGTFSCVNISWSTAGSTPITLHTSVKAYSEAHMALFIQELPQGAPNTNASNPILPEGTSTESGAYPPIVGFPAFRASGLGSGLLPTLGFVTWQGSMVNVLSRTNAPAYLSGLSSNGPVALFDKEYRTLVVSPMDNFKSAVHTRRMGTDNAWETGASSELESLPPGFVHRTLVVAGQGITATLDAWGTTLRGAYGTRRVVDEDPVVNYLSYWTDNGAFYYGAAWGEAGGGGAPCNETSMVDVAEGLESLDLLQAVRIWQLDDWWYPGQRAVWVHCVQNWTLTPPAFQHSLGELSKAVRTPWLLYVPFFCPENAYSDRFRFVQGSGGRTQFAEPHPDDATAFYRMLFDYGVENGMRGYENDFLNFNFLAVPHFRRTYNASTKWLHAIDTAAMERNLPVQMCMALPSDLMASVQLNTVTNYRASGDYAGGSNYDIGGSSLLAFALGLRPSKDNFWTHRPATAIATGKPWNAHSNPGSNCELNTIIATMSTGPVGIADKAGDTNRTLVMRSIRPDGLVIQPDKPATSIDATFMSASLGDTRPPLAGQAWATSASIPSAGNGTTAGVWHYLLSIDVKRLWQTSEVDFYPRMVASAGWVARRWHQQGAPTPCISGSKAVASGCLMTSTIRSEAQMPSLLNDRGIMVQNDTHVFDLMQMSPIGPNGWVLIGDTTRYASVSRKRFHSIAYTPGGISTTVSGVAGEHLAIVALRPILPDGSDDARLVSEWTVVVKQVAFSSSLPVAVHFASVARQAITQEFV